MNINDTASLHDIEAVITAIRDSEAPPLLRVAKKALEGSILVAALRSAGLFVADINRDHSVHDKETLFTALDQSVQFPWWFGRNWDALLDVLRDFDRVTAKGFVMILHSPDDLQESDLQTFIDVVVYANVEWKQRGVPFSLLIPTGSFE